MDPFEGFDEPTQNWSKLPHQFINALPLVETGGELKVILYILRHTWGFQDTQKRITLDEFVNGRKDRNRERMDNGTGLSKPTVINGIKRAVAHGFILEEIDDRDKARVKKFYSLRMLKDLTPNVKELDTECKEPLPRSEKETVEKKPKKDRAAVAPDKPANQMFSALARICRMNLKLITVIQRRQLNQTGKILREADIAPDDLTQFEEWWTVHDWRGRKGDAPRPAQVREEWGTFTDWRDNGQGKDSTVTFASGLGEGFGDWVEDGS